MRLEFVKVAASEGGSGPEVGGGWQGPGAVGGWGGFTVAPHPLLGSMAAPGPDAQGGAGGENPGKDMAALHNLQSMDWLFKKERIFLLAQFWQQVRWHLSSVTLLWYGTHEWHHEAHGDSPVSQNDGHTTLSALSFAYYFRSVYVSCFFSGTIKYA